MLGRGWNQELWPDKRFPTAADLDAVVADRPVALERVDGHALVVNSAALKAAGITAATKDPVGGKIERDGQGNPTGLLIDAARALVEKVVPPPPRSERRCALMKAQETPASASGSRLPPTWGRSRATGEHHAPGGGRRSAQHSHLELCCRPRAHAAIITRTGRPDWLYGDRLRMGGVKLYADGALGSRGAWLKAPYSDKPDTRASVPDGRRAQRTDRRGAKRRLSDRDPRHRRRSECAGDCDLRRAQPALQGDRRWRIEHVQVADPAHIRPLEPAGIIASMQPTHQTSDRLMAERGSASNRLSGRLRVADGSRSGAIRSRSVRTSRSNPQPLPRPVRGGQPAGHERPAAGRLAP